MNRKRMPPTSKIVSCWPPRLSLRPVYKSEEELTLRLAGNTGDNLKSRHIQGHEIPSKVLGGRMNARVCTLFIF